MLSLSFRRGVRAARLSAFAALASAVLAACGAAAAPTTAPAAPAATPASVNAVPTSRPAAPTAAPVATAATTAAKLNLNTASRDDFLKVPNVGDRMVREFFEYRPYTSILQFRRELGKYVTAQQVADYERYVYVPVDPNTSDADTLQQIPGVDKSAAAQLIAARPFASADAFLQALLKLAGTDAPVIARTYLVSK